MHREPSRPEIDRVDRPRSVRTSPDYSTQARSFAIALAVFFAIVLLVFGTDALTSAGRVHPGVRIDGISVGGMRQADARSLLGRRLGAQLARPVSIAGGGKSWTVDAPRLGVGFNANAAVEQAYAVGRRGNFAHRLAERLAAWVRPVRLPNPLTIDSAKLERFLGTVDGEIAAKPKNATVAIEGTGVRLVPAAAGTQVDRARATRDLRVAFASPTDRDVRLTLVKRDAEVSDAEARGALDQAKRMLRDAVEVTYGSKTWTFTPQRIAHWISFGPDPSQSASAPHPKFEAFIAAEEVSSSLAPTFDGIGRPAKDARFDTTGDQVEVIPSQTGTAVDIDGLARSLTVALRQDDGERSVELRLRKIQPSLTTVRAKTMGVKERISTYTTTYPSGNAPRVNNIHTLAAALDGTLVAPGGIFSFNGAVGPRTADKGYQEAPAIVNGKLVPQLGGGVCQVGTTAFNAAFFSGLPIVERRNHSFYISHYPTGRDATVSWGGPDLKFKNATSSWLLIRASFTSGSITISLYGTDPGYDVSYDTGPWTDARPFPVSETKDPKLAEGARVIEDIGVNGRTVIVTRTVKKGGRVVRTDTFKSVYRPKEQVVRVGTKRAETTPTP